MNKKIPEMAVILLFIYFPCQNSFSALKTEQNLRGLGWHGLKNCGVCWREGAVSKGSELSVWTPPKRKDLG